MKPHTHISPDYNFSVIGIASIEPIWKVCWELNQLLHTKLVKVELPHLDDLEHAGTEQRQTHLDLFAAEEIPRQTQEWNVYAQIPEEEGRAYYLIENNHIQSPKETRIFPFLLVAISRGATADTQVLNLYESQVIMSATDLFAENSSERFHTKMKTWLSCWAG